MRIGFRTGLNGETEFLLPNPGAPSQWGGVLPGVEFGVPPPDSGSLFLCESLFTSAAT